MSSHRIRGFVLGVFVSTGCLAAGGCAISLGDAEAVGSARQRVGFTARGWQTPGLGDVNADGLQDIVWTKPATSELAVWMMRGASTFARGPIFHGPPGPNWGAFTTADFNADGFSDIPLFNSYTKRLAIWLLRGNTVLAPGPPIEGPPGEGWAALAAADFDGDGMADVAWGNAKNGHLLAYLMHGTRVCRVGPELEGPPGPDWSIATAGDLNGDARGDLVFLQGTTNRVSVWLAADAGAFLPGPVLIGPTEPGWVLIDTVADFNGDGFADLLWNNPDRNVFSVWLMRGQAVLTEGPELPGPPGIGWSVGSAGDVNGDGFADVAFQRQPTDGFAMVLMAGDHLLRYGPELPGPGTQAP